MCEVVRCIDQNMLMFSSTWNISTKLTNLEQELPLWSKALDCNSYLRAFMISKHVALERVRVIVKIFFCYLNASYIRCVPDQACHYQPSPSFKWRTETTKWSIRYYVTQWITKLTSGFEVVFGVGICYTIGFFITKETFILRLHVKGSALISQFSSTVLDTCER